MSKLKDLNKLFNKRLLISNNFKITKQAKKILKNKKIKMVLSLIGTVSLATLLYGSIMDLSSSSHKNNDIDNSIVLNIEKKINDLKYITSTEFVDKNIGKLTTITEKDIMNIIVHKSDGVFKLPMMEKAIIILTNGDGLDQDLKSKYQKINKVIELNEDFTKNKKSSFAGYAYSFSEKEKDVPKLAILNFMPFQMHKMLERDNINAPVLYNYDKELSLFVFLHEYAHVQKEQALLSYKDKLLFEGKIKNNEKDIIGYHTYMEAQSDLFAVLAVGKMGKMGNNELADFIDGIVEVRKKQTEANDFSHSTGFALKTMSKIILENPKYLSEIKKMNLSDINTFSKIILDVIYKDINKQGNRNSIKSKSVSELKNLLLTYNASADIEEKINNNYILNKKEIIRPFEEDLEKIKKTIIKKNKIR